MALEVARLRQRSCRQQPCCRRWARDPLPYADHRRRCAGEPEPQPGGRHIVIIQDEQRKLVTCFDGNTKAGGSHDIVIVRYVDGKISALQLSIDVN